MIKIKKIIKIPGKSFNDLSLREVALMIEADSSMSPNGSDLFDSSALDVFLHNADLSRLDLLEIRRDLLEKIYTHVPGSKIKRINDGFLRDYAAELREKDAEL